MSATTTVTDTTTLNNKPDSIRLSTLYDNNNNSTNPPPPQRTNDIKPTGLQTDTYTGANDIESQPPSPKSNNKDNGEPEDPPGAVKATDPATFDRAMKWKIFATHFMIFTAGAHDGATGPLIPYLKVYYDIGLTFVALVYILSFLGWLVAALTIVHLTARLHMGGVIFIGATLQVTGRVLMCWAPPYPLYVICFFIIGIGLGYQDAHANTYNASLPKAHLFLGVLHAIYGVGAMVAPLMATAIANTGLDGRHWNYYYFCIVGIEAANMCSIAYAFKEDVSELFRKLRRVLSFSSASAASSSSKGTTMIGEDGVEITRLSTREEERREKNRRATRELRQVLSRREVWVLCGFFFIYVGTEVTAGGWVVEFLIEVRKGAPHQMGYIASAFWGGLTLGRVILAEPTERFGIRIMIFVYIAVSLGIQLVFWFVPSIIVGAVMIGLLGFFIGPFFPAGISLASKLLPQELHAGAISLMATVGCLGSAAFPFLTGAVAAKKGVQVLQPILVGLLAAMGLLWACVPRLKKREQQQVELQEQPQQQQL